MEVPSPTEKKYSAIICARNASGASFVVTDKPMGDNRSSEIAKTAMMPTTRSAGTVLPVLPAIGTNSRNAAPMPMTPYANLRGVVGARSPSLVHITAKSGESRMIHTGSIEPIQLDGAVHPKIDQFIRSSEYTASTVKIC